MSQVLNDGRVLVAYMGEQEAMSFFGRRCVFDGDARQKGEAVYASFAKAAKNLPESNTKVRVSDFDPGVEEYLEKVPTDRIRSGALRGLEWSFKKMEIDGLICIQKHINLSYVKMISRGCDFGKEEDLIDLCFTDRFLNRTSTVTKVAANEYKVSADGDDLMMLDSRATRDERAKTSTVSLTVGWGVPSVLVVRVGERYYLKNGCHRVYALKANGISYVPCVLVEAPSYESLGNPAQPGFFSKKLTTSDQAPTFSAFFSDRLSATLKMRPRHTVITLSAEVLKLPSDEESKRKEAIAALEAGGRPGSSIEDVRVLSEGWNVYSLADGNTLKIRQLVRGIARSADARGRMSFVASQTPLLVSVIPRSRGTPSTRDYGKPELEAAVIDPDIRFENIEEPLNSYRTKSGLEFTLSLALISVSRTSKFDRDGIPIYLIKTESKVEQAKSRDDGGSRSSRGRSRAPARQSSKSGQ